MTNANTLEIRKIKGKGRGIIARAAVAKDALVVLDEILPVPANENIGRYLDHYIFYRGGMYFLCLGIGSLINHSHAPNLKYRLHKKDMQLAFYAKRDIAAGEELFIDYEWDVYPWEPKKRKPQKRKAKKS